MGCASSQIYPDTETSNAIHKLKKEGFDFRTKKGEKVNVDIMVESPFNSAIKQCAAHICSTNGDLSTIKWLESQGANLRAKNSYNQTPLLLACERGNLDIAEYLLNKGCEGDMVVPANDGCTVLHLARGSSCVWILNKLGNEESTKLVSCLDNHGDTPLLLACLYGDIIACRYLVEKACLLLSQQLKTTSSSIEVIDTNMTSDKEEEKEDIEVPLKTMHDHHNQLDESTIQNPLTQHINIHGSSIIHNACVGGHSQVLRWLFLNVCGAMDYLTSKDCCGDTPMRLAVHWGNVDCCHTLIQFGALRSTDRESDSFILNRDIPLPSSQPLLTNEKQRVIDTRIKECNTSIENIGKTVEAVTQISHTESTPSENTRSENEENIPPENTPSENTPPENILPENAPLENIPLENIPLENTPSEAPTLPLQTLRRLSPPPSPLGFEMRKLLRVKALGELMHFEGFSRSILLGCLKKKSPLLSKLRKANQKIRDRPKVLIADFAGVLHGIHLKNIRLFLELLEREERPEED